MKNPNLPGYDDNDSDKTRIPDKNNPDRTDPIKDRKDVNNKQKTPSYK